MQDSHSSWGWGGVVRTVLLSTNFPRFDKTILSVIWLHLKYAFDSAAGYPLPVFTKKPLHCVFSNYPSILAHSGD